MIFQSLKQDGPLNGIKVTTPYLSKDHLQQKRYIAKNMNTTYIYDFIEMFTEAVRNQWEIYMSLNSDKSQRPDNNKLVVAIELHLDRNEQLQEVNRHKGENEVREI